MTRIVEFRKWRCKNCGELVPEPNLLRAPNPFDPDAWVTGCPFCKQCEEGFDLLCDENMCVSPATCGWPTGNNDDLYGGYRNTCGMHRESSNVE